MLKNIFKISKKYRLILLTSIAGIISIILTFITPTTKIYHVNFVFKISNANEYQSLFFTREINKEDLYLEITELINEHIRFIGEKKESSCKIALKNNNYNTFKYPNSYLVEFEISKNKKNLNATNECYDVFEQIGTQINNKYIKVAKFIYAQKYGLELNRRDKTNSSPNIANFLNNYLYNDEIKFNQNILTSSKIITETESLFDNRISRFFSFFIILLSLFIFLLNYKKLELLIKK